MKTGNEYTDMISPDFFDKCPKAVLAAIAVSYFYNAGSDESGITEALRVEWQLLYNQGIVPQKPPKPSL